MLWHLLKVITAYKPNKFSKHVKQATKTLHDEIESHPFFKSMIDGSLSDEQYYIYLFNLLPIYKSVEHFVLNDHLNSDLRQSVKIQKDIIEYSKICSHVRLDGDVFFCNEWLERFNSKDKFFKKAELYIRWLADLYGGQILKKNIKFVNKYAFKDVRKCIKTVRKLIEKDLNESNVEKFIEEINIAYAFHKRLADKILMLKSNLL